MKNPGRIFLTGDTHGEHSIGKLSSKNFPKGKELTKKDYVIILGDFGLLWSHLRTRSETYWLKWLDDQPWTTLVVPGNHENYYLWDRLQEKEAFNDRVRIISHSVWGLNRGPCYRIANRKILAIGGAHSHDREYRELGKTLWLEEEITEKDIRIAVSYTESVNFQVDYVLTHCAPTKRARGAMDQHRAHLWTPDGSEELLQKFEDETALEYKRWYCGHYHTDFGPTYDGKFECLYNKIVELTDD